MVNIGARFLGNRQCQFTVWAPLLKKVAVKIVSPSARLLPMQAIGDGYWQVTAEDIEPGTRYFYQLDGGCDRPDPASDFQPEGVHNASQVIDHEAFQWTDESWLGVSLDEMVIYELHVGTFTPEGTFTAIIPQLSRLKELGITALEIMPVAQFPGDRNWGYDGVYPYAVQNSYGGTDGLKTLVDACHREGIAVILDVVYNHLGPEGNYLRDFAPYFTNKYRTPWGDALNYDDAYSDGVRHFFIENALYWMKSYHIDALRLDAIHGIYAFSAKHFLEEMAEKVERLGNETGKKFYLIAESDLNDVRVIRPRERGGYGIDAQWSDDFHHALHALVTGEQQEYYRDFGRLQDLEKVIREGFVYSGQYSAYRKRAHGNSPIDEPANRFVVCCQNHDQIGNRAAGERLSQLTSFEGLKLAAATVLLSPYVPMLFMGEEYGEEAPFAYFISHSDPDLIEAVRKGRKEEFPDAGWVGEVPDPQDVKTFEACKLHWQEQKQGKHRVLWEFYQYLIAARRSIPALKRLDKRNLKTISHEERLLIINRKWEDSQVFCFFNFSDRPIVFAIDSSRKSWKKIVDSSETKWMGSGSALPEQLKANESATIAAKSLSVYQAL
jgi:maltooligosyltrehalose trehalohydrolase